MSTVLHISQLRPAVSQALLLATARTWRQKWQQMPATWSYIDPRARLLQRCAASAAVSGRGGGCTTGGPPPLQLLGLLATCLLLATSFPDATADALPAR